MKYLSYILVALLAVGNTSAAEAWEIRAFTESTGCYAFSFNENRRDTLVLLGVELYGNELIYSMSLRNLSWDLPEDVSGRMYVGVDNNNTAYQGDIFRMDKHTFTANIGKDLMGEILLGRKMYYRAGTHSGTVSLSGSKNAIISVLKCLNKRIEQKSTEDNPFGNEKDRNPFGNPVDSPAYDM